MKYADEIVQALKDVGCSPERPKFLIDTAASYGVTLAIHDVNSVPAGADALVKALEAAKIHVEGIPADVVDVGVVYVMVGLEGSKSQ